MRSLALLAAAVCYLIWLAYQAPEHPAEPFQEDIDSIAADALNGALITLKNINALMVEVTENHEGVSRLLKESGFDLYDERGNALSESGVRLVQIKLDRRLD